MLDTWVTSKQAVNIFATWCTARSWVFQPIDASSDFGKDGYVDITDHDGTLTGELFSVQVTGGESWSATDGYRIPVGKHWEVWMNSPLPVIGVAHDPKDGRLRSATPRQHSARIDTSCPGTFPRTPASMMITSSSC